MIVLRQVLLQVLRLAFPGKHRCRSPGRMCTPWTMVRRMRLVLRLLGRCRWDCEFGGVSYECVDGGFAGFVVDWAVSLAVGF